MSDFASSLAWCSIGIVDGDRKVSMEAMVQQHPCTERCDVGVSLRPYLGCRPQDKLCDLIRCSPHALYPRVVMSTWCQMCRLVDRWNGMFEFKFR